MKTTMYVTAALALSLASVGCATKRYVIRKVDPVEQRVAGTEAKNTEQDQQIKAQAGQLEALDRGLSSTRERLGDTDAKATAAASAALQANDAAIAANNRAQSAQQSADGAIQGTDNLSREVIRMVTFKTTAAGVVLFAPGQQTLTADAKAALDDFVNAKGSEGRYMIEVQGFTDNTGSVAMNEVLSQRRAEAVARYLATAHNIPLRSINLLGTGVAPGDQNTSDERQQSRRVEFRLLLPEKNSVTASVTNQ